MSSCSAPVAVMPQPSPAAPTRGPLSRLVDVPDCASSTAACDSSRMTFAGQRPNSSERATDARDRAAFAATASGSSIQGRCQPSDMICPLDIDPPPSLSLVGVRVASILRAPVPCSCTFAATVPARGLRATTMGSNAGLPFAAAPVVALGVAELATSRSAESDSATCASADATASAIPSVAVSGTEALRVCSHLAHSSVEVASALVALDDGPPRRHPQGGMVVCDVSGASSEFKVLKAVVVLDAVEVVDIVVGSERAANVALHDEAMLKDVEASACELNVSVSAYPSRDVSIAALTRAEAHHASLCPAGLDGEVSSARFAGESDSHSNPARAWWTVATSRQSNGTMLNGLRAHTIGSWLGLRPVPHPCHSPSRLWDFGIPDP